MNRKGSFLSVNSLAAEHFPDSKELYEADTPSEDDWPMATVVPICSLYVHVCMYTATAPPGGARRTAPRALCCSTVREPFSVLPSLPPTLKIGQLLLLAHLFLSRFHLNYPPLPLSTLKVPSVPHHGGLSRRQPGWQHPPVP